MCRYGDDWLDLVYGSPLARAAADGFEVVASVPFPLFSEQSLRVALRPRLAPRPLVVGDVHYGSGNHLPLPAHAAASASARSGAYWYPGGGCGWAVNDAALALHTECARGGGSGAFYVILVLSPGAV